MGRSLHRYGNLRSISRTCSKNLLDMAVCSCHQNTKETVRGQVVWTLWPASQTCGGLLVSEMSFRKQSGHKCTCVHRCSHARTHIQSPTRTWSSSSHKEHKHISSLFYLKRNFFIHTAEQPRMRLASSWGRIRDKWCHWYWDTDNTSPARLNFRLTKRKMAAPRPRCVDSQLSEQWEGNSFHYQFWIDALDFKYPKLSQWCGSPLCVLLFLVNE